ncbi:MAG TPA: hypothetical protein VES60_03445 [Nakamurella sp.]|nr:hypothetical protein [Nakamurella sp.]
MIVGIAAIFTTSRPGPAARGTRQQRFDAILDWWARYLPVPSGSRPA